MMLPDFEKGLSRLMDLNHICHALCTRVLRARRDQIQLWDPIVEYNSLWGLVRLLCYFVSRERKGLCNQTRERMGSFETRWLMSRFGSISI